MNRYFGVHTLDGEWHALLPRYLMLADRVSGKRILDIGCGTGIGSSMLLELGAKQVDAIDHRPAVLEIGRMKHAKENLDFRVMFWEELEFPDDVFDIVVCFDPTSPVTDPSLVSEIVRVLKPGGEYVCAIERSDEKGFEFALPKYGYADAAESVDVHPASQRVPQIGQLKETFATCHAIVQRPVLSYQFDVAKNDRAEVSRKVDEEGENGIFIPSDDSGRWLKVDPRLEHADNEQANVELWFCGGAELPAPPSREITLPYYGLARRLQTVIGTLQSRQLNPGGDPVFDEVLDEPVRERQITSEFRVVSFDDEPTNVTPRDDLGLDSEPTTAREDHALTDQLSQLAGLYNQVKTDFNTMVREAQNALAERDEYISHLVSTVHSWEERFRNDGYDDDPPTGEILVDDGDTTSEHEKLTPEKIAAAKKKKPAKAKPAKAKPAKKAPAKKKAATKKTTKKSTAKKATPKKTTKKRTTKKSDDKDA